MRIVRKNSKSKTIRRDSSKKHASCRSQTTKTVKCVQAQLSGDAANINLDRQNEVVEYDDSPYPLGIPVVVPTPAYSEDEIAIFINELNFALSNVLLKRPLLGSILPYKSESRNHGVLEKRGSVAERLSEYVKAVVLPGKKSFGEAGFEKYLQQAVGDFRNLDVIQTAFHAPITIRCRWKQRDIIRKLINATLLFAAFWVREPKDWDGETNILKHLFAIHEVPEFLLNTSFDLFLPIRQFIWLILVGQGASLRKSAVNFKDSWVGSWNVGRSFQRNLFLVPPHFTFSSGVNYAFIIEQGGNQVEVERMFDQRVSFDPLVLNADDIFSEEIQNERGDLVFWKKTLLWLIENREHLQHDELNQIFDWAWHKRCEAVRFQEQFSWKRRTLNSVRRRVYEYNNEMYATRSPVIVKTEWDRVGWDYEYHDEQAIVGPL